MANKTRKPPSHVEVFYDIRDRSFWFKLGGRYVSLGKSDMQMHMRAIGLLEQEYHDGNREIDWPMYNAQINAQIEYAGPLAGHRVGVFTDQSKRRYLITDEANGVWDLPAKKSPVPEFFFEFVQELLPGDQWPHFCHWLSIALRSLRAGDWRPGQVAILAGPALCGKSLLQYFVTQILGGRSASPFEYMSGEKFNYDLAKAEHWQIEDPDSTTDLRTRRSFGNKLKECANNEDLKVHQKGKDAFKLPVFRRITITINDEPENLAVCPPMDDSIQDKVSLYKCATVSECLKRFIVRTPALPGMAGLVGAVGTQDRAAIKRRVEEELPLIRSWLLRSFVAVPEEWRGNDRCGIRAYHHPELLEELSSLAPETRLLQLIDDVAFDNSGSPWTGKATELEKTLRSSAVNFEVEKVLRYIGSCGSYLGRLAKAHPDRITKRIKDGYTHWTIKAPLSSQQKEAA